MKKIDCPFTVTRAKFLQKANLSVGEIFDLVRMKAKQDEEGIINLFLENEECVLHSADPVLVRYDDYVIIFGYHSYLNKQVILIEQNGMVYIFTAKWGHRLFIGNPPNNIIYSVDDTFFRRNPKPVVIYRNKEYPS